MNFITALYAIQAPASALNNGLGEDTKGKVKAIRVERFEYPYVSAQAVRYWLRETLHQHAPEWQASPIYRGKGKQQAYTAGNPLDYWDDDLLGYMRAEKEKDGDGGTVTRLSPFRTSPLISLGPVEVVDDFGVMARDPGNPILHGHEFYRTTLVGSFSLDLGAVGCFTTQARPGYQHLNAKQVAQAQAQGLVYDEASDQYQLPVQQRLERISALLRALGRLEGGAKQTLHHTDVSPAFVCMAVLRGGNNPFLNLLQATPLPTLHTSALDEALTVYQEDFLLPPIVGLRRGFMDAAYPLLEERSLWVGHPRQAFEALSQTLWEHPEWLA